MKRNDLSAFRGKVMPILATLCPQSEPDEGKATAYRATIDECMAKLGKHGL